MRLYIEHFIAELLRQKDRWILWSPVAIAAGVGAYFSLHNEPPLASGLVTLGILALALIPVYRNRAVVWLLWLPLFLIVLGFAAAQWRTWSVSAPVLARKTQPLVLEGQVTAVEALPEGKYRFVLDKVVYKSDKPLQQNPMPSRVRLRLKKNDTPPQEGSTVRLRAMLLPLSQPVLPGAYDFQRHSFFAGLGATGFAISTVETLAPRDGGYFFESLRRLIRTRIRGAIGNNDSAAITTALLDGEDQDISKSTYDKLRTAGLAHLIAISGLQITLVTGFFFFAVRALLAVIPYVALRWPVKKLAAGLALLGAVFYMMLIGSSISAERSVIMVCAVMGAVMLDRDPFTLRMTAFAAVVILLLQPESLFGPSFQLSFAAVTALIAFYEATRAWWSAGDKPHSWFKRFGIYILASMVTTLVATLATAPISLYHFLRTPLFPGLVANLIAVPLSSFVTMPAAIIGCLLMPFGLESVPFKIADISVGIIMKTADITAAWPYAVFHVDAWPLWILVMMSFGGLWICLWQGRLRWAGAAPLVLGFVFIAQVPRADVLVSDSGKLFAARGKDGILYLPPGRGGKFVRDAWIEREAGRGHEDWDKPGLLVTCDGDACLYRASGHTVSFAQSYMALAHDCAEADIVISPLYIRREICPGPQVLLSKKNQWQRGAAALYFNGDGTVTVRSVGEERGRRPWSGADF